MNPPGWIVRVQRDDKIVGAVDGGSAEVAKGRAPREICIGAISQASRLEVVYGDHYAYRGILTFFGAHLFGVWKTAMGELVRMGHVSPETFNERLAELNAAIAETG